MSLTSLANIIRLKPLTRSDERSRFETGRTGNGLTLLARETRPTPDAEVSSSRTAIRTTVLLGLDFGSSQTSVVGQLPGVEESYLRRQIPSYVAVQAGEDSKTVSPYLYFGEDALNKGPRFQRVRPWRNGDIDDPLMARELARHVRDLMRRSETLFCRAVVGEPVNMSAEGKHHFRQALRGLFEEVIFLPRAYLAGVGLKRYLAASLPAQTDESPMILVDMGAGGTEGCLVGKTFPSASEMAGTPFGGDQVEMMIQEALRQEYPAFRPERSMVRSWKDEFGFVGEPASTVVVKVPLDSVERQIVLTNSLRRGCDAWLLHVVELIVTLAQRAMDSAQPPSRVFLTGGGSRLVHLAPVLTSLLAQRGLADMKVDAVPESEISLAASGALHAAKQVREDQWSRFALA